MTFYNINLAYGLISCYIEPNYLLVINRLKNKEESKITFLLKTKMIVVLNMVLYHS